MLVPLGRKRCFPWSKDASPTLWHCSQQPFRTEMPSSFIQMYHFPFLFF
jgi:hypothetical protein